MINAWDEIVFTGTQIYYFIIDPRRLWYFSKGIVMEHTSDLVEMGKIISQETFKRDKREIQIGRIKIDFYRKNCEVHEVKKSSKFEEASRWQLIYYLYALKNLGITCRGVLHFPKEKRVEKIELTPSLERDMEEILKEMYRIVNLPTPPKTRQSEKIKKASYWEFFMA